MCCQAQYDLGLLTYISCGRMIELVDKHGSRVVKHGDTAELCISRQNHKTGSRKKARFEQGRHDNPPDTIDVYLFDGERQVWTDTIEGTVNIPPSYHGVYSCPCSAVQGYRRSKKLQRILSESKLPAKFVIPKAHTYRVSRINNAEDRDISMDAGHSSTAMTRSYRDRDRPINGDTPWSEGTLALLARRIEAFRLSPGFKRERQSR